ncbi:hypothetical protein [Streptomyces sp. CA-132043]|uniref:hypothetical protein n=1 Tax=Streptomyces sp. CA-132043 TaxID=3240048 RepID=UPI003D904577
MTTLSVTGHMDLTEASAGPVREALRALLLRHGGDGLIGVSCIAEGADSLFADEVLRAAGRLVVVLPSRDYRRSVVSSAHAPFFDRLLAAAGEVCVMPYETAGRAAYEAANAAVLDRADRLVAVWNGEPPTGKGGGTADVVQEARARGIAVDVVWPAGAARKG